LGTDVHRAATLTAAALAGATVMAAAWGQTRGRETGATIEPEALVTQAVGAILQADGRSALALLDRVDESGLSEKDRATVACMRGRLAGAGQAQVDAESGVAGRALTIYRNYWRAAMREPDARTSAEQRLETELRQLLGASRDADMDALEPLLAEALRKEGDYSLQGQTGLLRELMIWSRQETRIMRVALPEEERDVKVELLDDFKSMGWGEYGTCGRRSTGGWATDEALFAVVPRYPGLDHEEFRVTFLGHETQHFADKAKFQDLQPWALEYRAKLVELAQANTTRAEVLDRFFENRNGDPAESHSYANDRVLEDVAARLDLATANALYRVDISALQSAAAALLREDTRRRIGDRT
jgi:hypothetical protein